MCKDSDQFDVAPMQTKDLDDVLDIEKLCFPIPWSRDAFLIEVEKNQCARYFVARGYDKVLGYGGIWIILDEGHITNIAVHPNFRRKGIGRVLLYALLHGAVQSGVKRATLEVRVSNIVAQNLYRQFDFERNGVRKKYYADNNEDAIIMWNNDIEKTLKKLHSEVSYED